MDAKRLTLPVLAERFDKMGETLDYHDRLLVRGEGPNQPALPERVRDMEKVFSEVGFWVRSIALLFAGQFVVVLVGLIYLFIKVLPILLQLEKTQIGGG